MKIYIPIISSIIFFYSFISHFAYFISSLVYKKKSQEIFCKKKVYFSNIENIFLLLSHLCIAFIMLMRTGISMTGTIIISAIGTLAHSSLFVSKLLHMYNEKTYSYINILFLLGQIGMVYIYCIEHVTENIRKMTWKQKHVIPYTFIVMGIYYFYHYYKKEKTGIISISNLLVCGVYFMLFALFLLHYKYYKFVSIF